MSKKLVGLSYCRNALVMLVFVIIVLFSACTWSLARALMCLASLSSSFVEAAMYQWGGGVRVAATAVARRLLGALGVGVLSGARCQVHCGDGRLARVRVVVMSSSTSVLVIWVMSPSALKLGVAPVLRLRSKR